MTELRVESLLMPAAALGPPNTLPPLQRLKAVSGGIQIHESVSEEARRYLGYGCGNGILPYGLQDDYDRKREKRALRVAVLENEHLRATFLLDYGGRLWSLIHKTSDRELLYRNPVFQPGNLAVRNAWFSGGVEWNAAVQGHSPFTCSPLFAAMLKSDAGYPMLRLYEWERIRGVPFQVDCHLPEDSPWLFVQVRVINAHDGEIPMYWWSNIAVPESPESRVLVPADAAYSFGYSGQMQRVPIPVPSAPDVTYPTNIGHSTDFFYDIPPGRRPWIAALDAEGRGLIQTSTSRQCGRKLFVWGMGSGGRRWQEFLSVPGHPYIEIQAGLARTQYECVPMPPRTAWTWTEAYGFIQASPEIVHGTDWPAAHEHVRAHLEQELPAHALEAASELGEAHLDRDPEMILQHGSGWGALERLRRERCGEGGFEAPGLPFEDTSIGGEQEPWLRLLDEGALPSASPAEHPGACMVQREWQELLEHAVGAGRGNHWLAWLHLGVMRYHTGDAEGAEQAWEQSLRLEPSPWALRNLAVLAREQGDTALSAERYRQARQYAPEQSALTRECFLALLAEGCAQEVIDLWQEASAEIRSNGRLRFLKARADLELGHFEEVESFLSGPIEIPDVREGEVALTDLWFLLHEKRLAAAEGSPVTDAIRERVREAFPPPQHIDFRMNTESL